VVRAHMGGTCWLGAFFLDYRRMLFVGPGDGEKTDAHEGYVTGRYRDGACACR
jgi:hypothetical protein